jgi:hypothetical protein
MDFTEWLDRAKSYAVHQGVAWHDLEMCFSFNDPAWRDAFDEGIAPEEAVKEEMSYWEVG